MPKRSYSQDQKQLINRYTKHGFNGMLDNDALELILYYAVPAKNARSQADSLIEEFGDVRKVFDAPLNELVSFPGMDIGAATLITLMKDFTILYLKKRMEKKKVVNVWLDMIQYFRLSMAGLKNEQFRVAFLKEHDIMIDIETLQDGTIDQSVVYPRRVIERALHHNATSLVFVHNHPNGDPHPSTSDKELTDLLVVAATSIDIDVLDHIIIGSNDFFSFHDEGLLKDYRIYPEAATVHSLNNAKRRTAR